jgi:hypothetical protein
MSVPGSPLASAHPGSGGFMPDGYRRVLVEFSDMAVPESRVRLDKHGDAAMEGTLPPEEDYGAAALAAHEAGGEGGASEGVSEGVSRGLAPKPKRFAVWLAPGQANALAPREGEREVFNQAVKVHVGEVPELAYESTMVVKVFEAFSRGLDQVGGCVLGGEGRPTTTTRSARNAPPPPPSAPPSLL